MPTSSNRTNDVDDWTDLGSAIHERRVGNGLTLVGLARKVKLSQPFLSQIENGRARPSLMSLHRIAEALGTTPQALFGGASDSEVGPVVVRANEVRMVDVHSDADATASESICQLLIAGDAPFHMLEFDGLPTAFLDYFSHDGFEATYVIAGRMEIDIDGTITELGPGDSISYSSRLPHRLRAAGTRRSRVLLIETAVERIRDGAVARHDPPRLHSPADVDDIIQPEVTRS